MFKFVVLAVLVASAAANVRPRLDGRIVGGENVDITEYPHQISLQYYGSHICGGSIIGDKWVVTAAHCTDGSSASSLSILAGVTNLNDNGQQINVRAIHQNPDFSMSNLDSDVSVLELSSAISLGSNAQPITLASDGSDPAEGTDVICTGWGATSEGGWGSDDLKGVKVQIVGRDRCSDQYGSGMISERMICAGVDKGGKDACQGDSGGPLVADGKLVGIVSWGYGCARPDYAGVYSNVGALRSYIKEQSGI
ncbi:trypsin-1-like [Atheta coriaria]|uniref:trypsin-1-like n=1 Tax=Dalotia coriaria TaxID=877792 RepID=UPI0031F34575